MIRVLLVDDEMIIRMGLRKMIENNCPEFAVVGEAPDGRKALEMLDACHPDICIVDIRMPHMTGLQFMERAAASGCRARMVVLSGYAEFQFAQEAMANGCGGYLLKPVKPEELAALLQKLKSSIESSRETERKKEDMQRLANRQKDAYCKELLRKLAMEGGAEECRTLEMEGFLPEGPFIMAIFSEDDYKQGQRKPADDSAARSHGEVILKTVRSFVETEPGWPGISLGLTQDMTLLLMYGRAGQPIGRENTAPLLGKIQSALKEQDISVTIGCSGADRGVNAIRPGYLACREAIGFRFYQGRGKVFFYRKDFFCNEDPNIYSLEKKLSDALFVKNSQQVYVILNEIFSTLSNMRLKKSVIVMVLCHIHFSIMNILYAQNRTELLENLPDLAEYEHNIQQFDVFPELQEYVFEVFYQLLELGSGEQSEKNRQLVRKALQFIETHYDSPIYSNEMAEYLNLNVSYFSTLFHRETGEKFTVFLTNYKIEKACEMLLQTNDKVHRISERLGYSDVKYFCKVFRRRMNCTPSEYREGALHGAVNNGREYDPDRIPGRHAGPAADIGKAGRHPSWGDPAA